MSAKHLLLLSLLLSLGGCSSLIFYPNDHEYITPNRLGINSTDLEIKVDNIRLHGWWLHSSNPSKGTVIFLHGNAQNISAHIASVYWLPENGYDVILFDYRGYGKSEGEPDLTGVHADFAAVLDYVFSRDKFDKNRIIVFGQSLGAAIAIVGVAQSKYKSQIKALVIEGAFTSYRTIAREKLNESWLTWLFQWPLSYTISDDIRPIDKISQISPVPVLIIQGEDDGIIPLHHGIDLYTQANEPKVIWQTKGISHIRTFLYGEYRTMLLNYLQLQLEGTSLPVK